MMKIIKRVVAPVRIDFAGGTTDITPFTHIHGGAVLNGAINRYVKGELIKSDTHTELKYSGNIPTSSGLGTSGVMNLVWLSLISESKDKLLLAERVYGLEQSMGLVGGKQDQYAGALGGINYLEFIGDKVKIERLNLNKELIKKFEGKLVLVYTGKPHFSEHSNKSAIDNLIKGKNVKHLIRLKEVAKEMRDSLVKKDLYKFAELMNLETHERERLHKSIVSPHLKKFIIRGMANGAISAKVCGSGNGGCLLFYTEDKRKLVKHFLSRVIDFKFDFEGLRWK